jgi:hypothetical protein
VQRQEQQLSEDRHGEEADEESWRAWRSTTRRIGRNRAKEQKKEQEWRQFERAK